MNVTIQLLFALLRSFLCGQKLNREELSAYTDGEISRLADIASEHDLLHLLSLGLEQNGLYASSSEIGKAVFKAIYRYEQLSYDLNNLSYAFEQAHIPFIPLKGAVMRRYYPEPWMRTSCDIDVLVHREDLDRAITCLVTTLGYEERSRGSHDVALYTPSGSHIELHFDMLEEGDANGAIDILKTVWERSRPKAEGGYLYEMPDEMFYFYHIAHMAKHFENGGCGIKPLVDLWILDQIEGVDCEKRDSLLKEGGLLRFAESSRKLYGYWFEGGEADDLILRMESFVLHGGAYGSAYYRVALRQKKKGGRLGYLISRVFAPYSKMKRYYPILEKHPWLTPVFQVVRWFMLLTPNVAKLAKAEFTANSKIEKNQADEMKAFLESIGL